MHRLYEFPPSGNCYKVRLMLAHLGIPYERVFIDTLAGEGRGAEHRKRNPIGRVPVLEIDEGGERRLLPESNAILWYLAEGTPYVPGERWLRAKVLQWMFFEQYSHEPNIATARFWIAYKKEPDHPMARIAERQERGREALGVMEQQLAAEPFLVGGRYSIADIALFAYTHVAHEGGFDLAPYPGIRAWIDRVKAQPGHVSIEG